MSRSSSKVEYRGLENTTDEAQWLLYLLKGLFIDHMQPVTIFFYNKSVIHIASNLIFHKKMKHIEMDCHHVRDKVQAKLIHLMPINFKNQVIDVTN